MNPGGKGYGALVGGSTLSSLLTGGGLPPYFLTYTGGAGMYTPTGIAASTYTVSGPGGTNVGAFSSSLTVSAEAAAFKWTNEPAFGTVIPRNTPLTVTWTGGDPNGFVGITLTASGTQQALLPLPTDPGVLAQCVAPASAGSFTIPTYVLSALPPSFNTVLAGELQVGPASGAAAISPAPSGLDAAWIFYHYIAGQIVVWQ